MAIELDPETRKRLSRALQAHFLEHFDEEIGELKTSLLIDFCLERIGPAVYNQAIAEAQSYLQERVVDLDTVCYQPELDDWDRSAS